MKKMIIKLIKWTSVAAFLVNVQPSKLFAPNLANKKGVFQVASSTSSYYGQSYAFKAPKSVSASPTFSLIEPPRKILIPESSIASNAVFVLTFDNPAADIVTQAKIFDLTGAEVVDMTETTGSGSNPAILRWDGRDKNGSVVRSGIYIYQVQAGGALINGTVVVAR